MGNDRWPLLQRHAEDEGMNTPIPAEQMLPENCRCLGDLTEPNPRCPVHGYPEHLEDEGHDPDLDENGVCRVCGEFEPE